MYNKIYYLLVYNEGEVSDNDPSLSQEEQDPCLHIVYST